MNLSKNKVPHSGPVGASILILGEAPGEDEDYQGQPFVGRSGEFLNHLLELAGLNRSECRVANVLNYRPSGNDFKQANGSPELESSIQELTTYLNLHPPKIILALGNEALRFCVGHDGISKWRGSVLRRDRSYVIPTYHPAAALRAGDIAPQIVFDFKRAAKVLRDGYTPPTYDFEIAPYDIEAICRKVKEAEFVATDIESHYDSTQILCIGFAWSATEACVIKNSSDLGVSDNFKDAVEKILQSCRSNTYHNGTYDVQVLEENGILVARERYDWDTMFAQRILEPELPIGLDFCTSIYTDQQYYKDDGKQIGKKVPLTLYTYNATDCVCTWQTRKAQQEIFASRPDDFWSFQQDMADVPVTLAFQRNGMLVDQDRMFELENAIQTKLNDALTTMYILAGGEFNHRSPLQTKKLLYDTLGLPKRTKMGGQETTGEDAVVSLLQFCKREYDTKSTARGKDTWMAKMGVLKMLLQVRGYEKLLSSYLRVSMSSDGRVRAMYKQAGTETGRYSAGLYADGTGFNPQTLPREVIEV